jgi:putative transposase
VVRSFPNIVKQILKHLPKNDYPVLHSCLFFQIWLTCILDKSLTSMRDLFYLLNHSGITVDISTFSKACKPRCDRYFRRIYTELRQQLIRNHPTIGKMLFPIDSTVVSLTSKLFYQQGQHQVKLLNGVNVSQGYGSACLSQYDPRRRHWHYGSRFCFWMLSVRQIPYLWCGSRTTCAQN